MRGVVQNYYTNAIRYCWPGWDKKSKARRLSKKVFKKALGGLYKDGLLELTDQGVRLK
jgi:hypothetical protein